MRSGHSGGLCLMIATPFTVVLAPSSQCTPPDAGGLTSWIRKRVRDKSLEKGPLPVVILGTNKSSIQSACRAIKQATLRQVKNGGRPIEVIALYRDGILAVCDRTTPERDSPANRLVAQWARTSLAIADDMRTQATSHQLRNRMLWLQTFAEYCHVEHAVIAAPVKEDAESEELLSEAAKIFKHVLLAPQVLPQAESGEISVHSYSSKRNSLSVYVADQVSGREPGTAKTLFDLVFGIILSVLGLPIFLLIALFIRIDSPGPILSQQIRIGRGNRTFTAFTFRTTCAGAIHKSNSPLTRVGRFLHRFKIHELPQLWNVLRCEMSVVGPRPIIAAEAGKYGRSYAAYERAKPGLTGLWRVFGGNATSYRQRAYLDAWYGRNWSLGLDLLIVLKTFTAALSGLWRPS